MSHDTSPGMTSLAFTDPATDLLTPFGTAELDMPSVRTASPSHVGLVRIEPRQALFRQDEAATRIYEIVEGSIMLMRHLADGRRQVLSLHGRGDVVGLPLTPTHSETAQAVTKASLKVYDANVVLASRRLQGLVLDRLGRQTEDLRDLALTIGRRSAAERIAYLLLKALGHSVQTAKATGGPAQGDLHLSQADMADHLGLTVETVCRNLGQLKREGIISQSAKSLRVRDLAALAARVDAVTCAADTPGTPRPGMPPHSAQIPAMCSRFAVVYANGAPYGSPKMTIVPRVSSPKPSTTPH